LIRAGSILTVTRPIRTVQRNNDAAFAVWITGLPASGKSTVAAALAQELGKRGVQFAVLESDALRKLFPVPASYDERDREYFYGSLAFIGEILTECGISVVFDATANRRAYRDRARQRIRRFVEVFVDCPLDVCMKRDPKGIYRRAREGGASHVPGLQAPYEPPETPELIIRGDQDSPEEAAHQIVNVLTRRRFLQSDF
jgi:adenylylsulfate kinase